MCRWTNKEIFFLLCFAFYFIFLGAMHAPISYLFFFFFSPSLSLLSFIVAHSLIQLQCCSSFLLFPPIHSFIFLSFCASARIYCNFSQPKQQQKKRSIEYMILAIDNHNLNCRNVLRAMNHIHIVQHLICMKMNLVCAAHSVP